MFKYPYLKDAIYETSLSNTRIIFLKCKWVTRKYRDRIDFNIQLSV